MRYDDVNIGDIVRILPCKGEERVDDIWINDRMPCFAGKVFIVAGKARSHVELANHEWVWPPSLLEIVEDQECEGFNVLNYVTVGDIFVPVEETEDGYFRAIEKYRPITQNTYSRYSFAIVLQKTLIFDVFGIGKAGDAINVIAMGRNYYPTIEYLPFSGAISKEYFEEE